MGDHYYGRTLFSVDAAEKLHDTVGSLGVEVPGRLVGYDDFRAVQQGTGNGNSLLLASGQLVRHLVRLMRHPHGFEHIAYPSVIIESYEHLPNKEYAKVRFCGISTSEEARALTNHTLYTTIAQSRADCVLKEGEFFWFDIIGCEIIESSEILGRVQDIERIGSTDYMLIATNPFLIETYKLPKTFLLPYIERFITHTDISQKRIYAQNARGILENS